MIRKDEVATLPAWEAIPTMLVTYGERLTTTPPLIVSPSNHLSK